MVTAMFGIVLAPALLTVMSMRDWPAMRWDSGKTAFTTFTV